MLRNIVRTTSQRSLSCHEMHSDTCHETRRGLPLSCRRSVPWLGGARIEPQGMQCDATNWRATTDSALVSNSMTRRRECRSFLTLEEGSAIASEFAPLRCSFLNDFPSATMSSGSLEWRCFVDLNKSIGVGLILQRQIQTLGNGSHQLMGLIILFSPHEPLCYPTRTRYVYPLRLFQFAYCTPS